MRNFILLITLTLLVLYGVDAFGQDVQRHTNRTVTMTDDAQQKVPQLKSEAVQKKSKENRRAERSNFKNSAKYKADVAAKTNYKSAQKGQQQKTMPKLENLKNERKAETQVFRKKNKRLPPNNL
jgi:preprotein translocase subunit SecF